MLKRYTADRNKIVVSDFELEEPEMPAKDNLCVDRYKGPDKFFKKQVENMRGS